MFEMRDYNGVRTISYADYGKAVAEIEAGQTTADEKQAALDALFDDNGAVAGWAARMDHMYDKED